MVAVIVMAVLLAMVISTAIMAFNGLAHGWFNRLFQTHPPIEARIALLQEVDGTLPAATELFREAKVAHLWNQASVVRSWLVELADMAFSRDPKLEKIAGYVEDSGEGRWTVQAIDLAVPAPVITLSLLERFSSRQDESFSAKVLAALRNEFGGHPVRDAAR